MVNKLSGVTVLCCRGDGGADGGSPTAYDDIPGEVLSSPLGPILAACRSLPIHLVGPRPGKAIDALLAGVGAGVGVGVGRVLVVGDDADLNAVVLRLLRKDLLGAVAVGFAAAEPTPVTRRYLLPTGAEAVAAALHAEVDLVPLVRNDSGGVLVGLAQLAPITGTFYVDAERVPGGAAKVISVEPDARHGVAVTVVRRRLMGFGRQPRTYYGRAVEFGIVPGSGTTIISDGVPHPREVKQWVFYKHTSPLRLVRGLY